MNKNEALNAADSSNKERNGAAGGSANAAGSEAQRTVIDLVADGVSKEDANAPPSSEAKPVPIPKAKTKTKIKKKRIPKCSLFKHNLITTSRKPHWSADGLLLCMVAGVSRDKSNDCIHIFHRSNLTKKVTTIVLPESCHATAARFHPLRFTLSADGAEKGSIVEKYGMSYRMLLAVICGSELFVFDTAKTKAVFYWKDQDAQNFFDMQWTCDGKALIVADVEGFLSRLCLAETDLEGASTFERETGKKAER